MIALIRSCAAIAVLLCSVAVLAQSPAEPAAAEAAKPAKEIKLFDGTSLKNWKILDKIDFDGHGEVAIKDGELVLNMGRPMTGVKWAGQELLRTNYEITFQARRIEGSDFFCGMTFPVEKSHCSLILGGWGGSLTGLSSLDGFDASENETTGSMVFKDGQWYKIRLRVTPEKIGGLGGRRSDRGRQDRRPQGFACAGRWTPCRRWASPPMRPKAA